ncbi:MAG: NAD(P)/FAD-dependent oxidoreductase [Bacteroidota bacterium]
MTLSNNNLPVWDDLSWQSLQQLDRELTVDACVVGLGGSGLACIGELQRMGLSVAGIDAGDVGAGAAGRNGGFLLAGLAKFHHHAVEAFGHERALNIYRLTMDEIDRMMSETPEAIRRIGTLRVALRDDEVEDCRKQLEAMQADGLPALKYDGPEGTGLLIPTDGAFNPLQRCRILASRAMNANAQLFSQSPARSLRHGEVTTPHGRILCDQVFVCVDGGLELVLPELAPRVRTARLQMLASAPTNEIHVSRPVYARFGYEYWQQLADGRIALGGFRDLGGEDEWTTSVETSSVIQSALENFLRTQLRVHAAVTHRWSALVAYTTTGLPIVEEVRPGVWATGAYSGTGNVIGALCGRGIARLAIGNSDELVRHFLA